MYLKVKYCQMIKETNLYPADGTKHNQTVKKYGNK
jgi:hypothetical protein